jgi:hypothetical protein
MAILLIHYRTQDFGGWKEVFDRDPMDRGASGVTRHWIYRDADDPEHVILSLEFQTVLTARKFLNALEPVRDVSGVVQASVLEEAEVAVYGENDA